MGVSETVLAAMIGAGATLLTALFQLVSSFRSSGTDRRKPRSGLRSLLWTIALIVAAGVGGFAYAELRSEQSRDEVRLLRQDLQQQMHELAASTARLEHMRLAAPNAGTTPATGAGVATATVTLPLCKGAQIGFASQRGPCTEQEALQVSLCAPVPVAAQVSAIELYGRLDDTPTAWSDARAVPGQDVGAGRFAETSFERPDADNLKLVCQSFSHWNSEKARTVRLVVRYNASS